MARKLKVYGWTGYRREIAGFHNQSHEIVAATSKAEVARLAGVQRPGQLFNLRETGNHMDIAIALTYPGVILWRPLNTYAAPYTRADTGEQIEVPEVYSDAALLARAIGRCHKPWRADKGTVKRYEHVADALGVPQMIAKMLCRRFGLDPEETPS